MNKTKSFDIPKQLIWRAYKQVSKNKGATGVDEISITKFEENLKYTKPCISIDSLASLNVSTILLVQFSPGTKQTSTLGQVDA
ncbi:MAG: hypothetical protein U0X86_000873 [Wolbachia endosymbiont of Xenopsylla cheopis]